MGMDLAVAGVDHQPFVIGLVNQNFQQFLPYAFISPTDETAMRVAPAPQIGRQVTPRSARANDPENSIYKQSIILCHPAPCAFAPRQMWFQQCPCLIRNIMPSVRRSHANLLPKESLVPGRLELAAKFSDLPKPPNVQGGVKIGVPTGAGTVTAILPGPRRHPIPIQA